MREAARLRALGSFDSAYRAAQLAEAAGRAAQEPWIAEYSGRVEAGLLVAQGQTAAGERQFAAIAATAEDATEVDYEAAVALHLHGDLGRALIWYRRGLDAGAVFDGGKSKHEFLKGEVLALLEERRFSGALAAIDSYNHAFAPQPVYREFVRWRAGETPLDVSVGMPLNATDLHRYWALECRFASGDDPRQVLAAVNSMLREKPETRGELLSLQAELLARIGQPLAAAQAARTALAVVSAERASSIIARGHFDLVRERQRRLAGGERR